MSDAYQALATIRQNIGQLDTAAGGAMDGLFNKDDLKKLLEDQYLKPELREAVNFLLNNNSVFNQVDAVKGGRVDGIISGEDVTKFLADAFKCGDAGVDKVVDALLKKFEDLEAKIDGLTGNDSGVDKKEPMTAAEAAEVLKANFKTLDAVDNIPNGAARLDSIANVLKDQTMDQDLRDAINFFLNNPAMAKAMETAGSTANADGLFKLDNLNAFVKDNPLKPSESSSSGKTAEGDYKTASQKTAPDAAPAPAETPATTSGGSGGGLSIGDIAAMLGELASKTERALEEKTKSIGGKKTDELTMDDNRELQKLGEIMKAFSTLFANLIKSVAETGDKSASKI